MNYHFLKIIASVRHILAGMLILVNFYAKAADPEFRQKGVRISTFDINATPPVESFLAYGNAAADWDMGLRARGIVLLVDANPISVCVENVIKFTGCSLSNAIAWQVQTRKIT
jgi:hypothetical protein